MKVTSIFGGVQILSIVISVIRSKFIAVLLGSEGMGIVGLINATTGTIASLTEFGIGTSAVKNISAANASNDTSRLAMVSSVLHRLVWITGLLGSLVTLVFAKGLSRLTFGNGSYTLAFIWISITLLFTQLTSGQFALLQGMRKVQYLAKANLIGSLLGLFISIPIYFIWGLNGIVPAIIISSIIALVISTFFSSKINIKKVSVNSFMLRTEGVNMLRMGILISLNGLFAMGASYFVRIYINHLGGLTQVGLYNAGFAIINTYVVMIFTAMSTDYYPRLSGIADDNNKVKKTINQQAEIAILILAPILTVFLVFISWIVILLYSSKFLEINEMIHWAALGMFFKATSWAINFILLAKGESRLFFWSELITCIYMFVFNILGYKFWGLEGLGISFLIGYLIYTFQVFIIAKRKYSFSFNSKFYEIFFTQLLILTMCFITIKTISKSYAYLFGIIFIIISCVISFRELDKRIGLKAVFHTFIIKLSKK
jgi:O-antigen/teichoic acid export membrane protein